MDGGVGEMRRLLAVGVIDSWTGDWNHAQGNERGFIAAPIGEGEKVWLEIEERDGTLRTQSQLSAIPSLFNLDKLSRYRVVKDASGAAAPCATSVEVIL